jgi:hypothetical protein
MTQSGYLALGTYTLSAYGSGIEYQQERWFRRFT